MKKFTLGFIILVILTFGCKAPQTFVSPDYQNQNIDTAKLLISTPADSNVVYNHKVFEDIGFILSRDEYLTVFGQALEENLETRSNFLSVDYIKHNNKSLISQSLKINEDKMINLNLPGKPLETNINGSVFILFLQDLDITMLKEPYETSKPNKYYSSSGSTASQVKVENMKFNNYSIAAEVIYAIVDNKNANVVSYGSITSKEQYMVPNSVEDVMNKTVRGLVKNILNSTPFK